MIRPVRIPEHLGAHNINKQECVRVWGEGASSSVQTRTCTAEPPSQAVLQAVSPLSAEVCKERPPRKGWGPPPPGVLRCACFSPRSFGRAAHLAGSGEREDSPPEDLAQHQNSETCGPKGRWCREDQMRVRGLHDRWNWGNPGHLLSQLFARPAPRGHLVP